MSGYREHSYDPNAYEPQGKPLRPYNIVQWVGVACVCFAVAVLLVEAAQRFGALPKLFDDGSGLVFGFSIVGMVLVNSRRESVSPDRLPELRRKQRRAVAVALIVMVVFAAIALVLAGVAK